MKSTVVIPVFLAAFAAYAPAHAKVTFIGANVFTDGYAAVAAGNRVVANSGTDSAYATKAHSSIDAPLSVFAEDKKSNTAFVHEDAFADFSSAKKGTVEFGGTSSLDVQSLNGAAEAYDSGTSFDYDFKTTSNYLFTVTYSYAETDPAYIANYFQLIGQSGPPLVSESPADGSFGAPSTGTVSYLLTPGTYEFGAVTKLGDLAFQGGPGFSEAAHSELYSFNLTSAVPEPATWALMVLGIGGAGLAFRQARTKRAFSFA